MLLLRRYPRKNNSSGAMTPGRIVFQHTHEFSHLHSPHLTPTKKKFVVSPSPSASKIHWGPGGRDRGDKLFFWQPAPEVRELAGVVGARGNYFDEHRGVPTNSENRGTHAHRTSVCQKGKCCFGWVLFHLNNHERPTHMHFKEKLHQRA